MINNLTIPQSKNILPFRWAGGKFYALKLLKPFWEAVLHDEYRETFLGGGSVFFTKSKVKYNWLNDIDPMLIKTLNYFKNENTREELIEMFDNEPTPNKIRHNEIKNLIPKNELEEVFKYYYLNRTSFSGKMKNPYWGYRDKRSLPPKRWKERIIPVGEKLKDVTLTNMDFSEILNTNSIGKKLLYFLDPPYYKAKQEEHYKHSFKEDDHKRLAQHLSNLKHSFFLTYDDCVEVRELYHWANIYQVKFYYRIENSSSNGNKRVKANELVITNYKVNLYKQIEFEYE